MGETTVTISADSAARCALITGAARRVGRAMALRMAEAGVDICFTYLSSEQGAKELAGEVESMGRRAVPLQADLTRPGLAVARIVKEFGKTFTRLDLLVNNASIFEPDITESGNPPEHDGQQARIAQLARLMAIHVE